jgi:hypothetical protein
VVQLPETRELILPEGLIPFQVSKPEARRAFREWLKSRKLRGRTRVTPVRGLYFPIWTFDLVGEIRWRGHIYRDDDDELDMGGISVSFSNTSSRLVRKEGSYPVLEDDILVPASHKLPVDLIMEAAKAFSLGDVVPYDEAYLADWPAEVYDTPVSDASLVARRKMLEKNQPIVRSYLSASSRTLKDARLSTSGVVVESFKLILLPVLVARYRRNGKEYRVVVNGQTGTVSAQEPRSWLRRLVGDLFD